MMPLAAPLGAFTIELLYRDLPDEDACFPALARKLAGTGKPRIHKISAPFATTGQSLRSGSRTCRSCNSSFTFFAALVWAGQKRSPARQFRTFNSVCGNNSALRSCCGLYSAMESAVLEVAARLRLPPNLRHERAPRNR